MRWVAVICFALSAASAEVAYRNISAKLSEGAESTEHLTGFIVGTCLVPVILLIAGLKLWNRP